MVDPTYVVEPTGNWYFMMVSTFLITILGTIITEKVVAPRFGEYHGNGEENETSSEYKLNDQERKALKVAGLTLLVMILVLVAFCLPANSVMRAEDGTLLGNSPFMEGIIPIITVLFFVPSVVYGHMTATLWDVPWEP